MPNHPKTLIHNTKELLQHLKSRTHAYHLSNVFFRDFQYAILSFAETKGLKLSYGKAEGLAGQFIAALEESGILKPIKPGSWMLNYPEYKKASQKTVPQAKPVVASSASTTSVETSVTASSKR
jgi:hypothetical protein